MQCFVVAMLALLFALLPMSKVMAYSGYVGESIYLSAPSTPGTIDGAAWSDGNSAQVKIDGNHYGATVTILSYFSGTITIQLKYAYSYYSGGKKQYVTGQYAYYDITCIPSTVTLDKKSVTLKPGEEVDLTYTNSSGYPLPDLTWTTSNYDVAYLESGYDRIAEDAKTIRVTANKPGECTIKCEGYSGNTAPTCKIIVKGDPPTAISLPATATTRVGESVTLSPTLTPKDAYTKISWKSSDESIATVSSGKVTGKKTGKVTITATTDNGLSATCSVTIGKGTVTLKADTESGVYAAGKTIKLTASRSDADIYYTLDGSTPTTNSTRYTGPITLNKSVTLKAIATGSNYDASDVLTRQYTITSLVVKDYWSETEEQTPFFIPSVTFSKAVSKNVACSNVKLQKGNTTVSGQSIVQDGILYFVPDSQLDVGNYKLIIPESAVMDANGEPNLKLEMNLKIGSGVERVTMIYGGDLYTSAIKADGTLWAWGDNELGRLGDGTRSNRYKPVKILDAVSQVSVGYGHTLAVKPDNTLWAWGRNNGGQLGVGTVGSLDTPTKVMDEAVKAYACEYHSFAIKADGSLWAWGNNGSGRLGDGTTTDRLTPVKIMDKVAHVVSERSHSMAIKTDGSLWAWGYNGYGQLGDGTTTNKLEPVKIMTNVVQIVSVNAVATLEASSFAIKTDGSLWAWGHNKYGQLGDGTTTNQLNPIKIMDNVVQVVTSRYTTMVIKADGSLWGWGRNVGGMLGDGTKTAKLKPTKIMDNVTQVTMGDNYSLAIKNDASLWAWGGNECAQLGDGTYTDRTTPIKVMDDVAQVTQGSKNFFALNTFAIKSDGTLWGWGDNGHGQLGDGTAVDRKKPICIIGSTAFEIVTGISFSSQVCQIPLGSHYLLLPRVSPVDGCYQTLDFKSSNPEIATVSSRGIVEAKKIGTTTITVTADGSYTATCKIEVKEGDAEGQKPQMYLSATPFGGEVSIGTKVYLSTPNATGADIYYTLNGNNPSVYSTKYTSVGITINESCTLKAIAYKENYETSDVLTVAYTVLNTASGDGSLQNPYNVLAAANKAKDLSIGETSSASYYVKGTISSIKYQYNAQYGTATFYISDDGTTSNQFYVYGSYYLENNPWVDGNPLIKIGDNVIVYGKMTNYNGILEMANRENYVYSHNGMTKTGDNSYEYRDVTLSYTGNATFYDSQSAYLLPNGLKASIVTGSVNNKLTYLDFTENIVPKGVAVMLTSDDKRPATYMLAPSQSTITYTGTNLLRGSDESTMTTGDGYHYKLSYGEPSTTLSDVFGWYWGAQNGSSFQIEGHKAWLVVPKSAATRGFTIEGDATGIFNINHEEQETEFFDLFGCRVSTPSKKGMYIKNGKIVIIK